MLLGCQNCLKNENFTKNLLPYVCISITLKSLKKIISLTLFLFKTIIFIRDYNAKGQEISGYIDYAHRLKTEDFEPYFSGKKKLLPKPSDLSFYNWENQMIASNNTPNYQVIAESVKGILFKNKRDRKILNVDPHVRSDFS